MKNVVRRVTALSLLLLILVMTCGFADSHKQKIYVVERIMNTIEELSSKDFSGRMAGTPGGIKTEDYVASKFKEIGLVPGGEAGTYFQEFTGECGNAANSPVLEVLDNGKIVKNYVLGRDYYYALISSHNGDAAGKGVPVELGSPDIKEASGEIALIGSSYYKEAAGKIQTLIGLYNAGYRGFILEMEKFKGRSKGAVAVADQSVAAKLPRVMVPSNIYKELLDYSKNGYKIHIKSDYVVQDFKARNVIGILKASSPTEKCLIISAHMDHVGQDPDGAYFPGALDNASGTACMLEIARALSDREEKPDVNVIFIAFSGEEEGLLGSAYYAEHPFYPLGGTRMVNMDMVGTKSDIPMSIASSSTDKARSETVELVQEFSVAADSQKSEYEVLSMSASDHDSLAKAGVPAVTIIDMAEDNIHRQEDNLDNIGVNNLIRDMDVIMEVIGNEAYPVKAVSANVNNQGSSLFIYILCGLGVIAVISAVIIYTKRKRVNV